MSLVQRTQGDVYHKQKGPQKNPHSSQRCFTYFSTYTHTSLFSVIMKEAYQVLGLLMPLHSSAPLCESTMPYIPKANNSKKQFDREAQIKGDWGKKHHTLLVIWDQLQTLVTVSLRIMKPVCITANLLQLGNTVFPFATEHWDHPGLAFWLESGPWSQGFLPAGQTTLKYILTDLSLSQTMSWSAISLACFLSLLSALCQPPPEHSEYMPDFEGWFAGRIQLSLYNAIHPTGHTM